MARIKKGKDGVRYANDLTESTGALLRLRLPVLVLGLMGGIATSVFVSRFEKVLSENVAIAFFVPLMVYISDAIATQTETIYIRNLRQQPGKKIFWIYMRKELMLGLLVGLVFGTITFVATYLWMQNIKVSATIGIAMAISMTCAPIVSLLIASLMLRLHKDPAVGAGPFATLIGDVVTLLIYFAVATLIFL